jgi:hypothetical protein
LFGPLGGFGLLGPLGGFGLFGPLGGFGLLGPLGGFGLFGPLGGIGVPGPFGGFGLFGPPGVSGLFGPGLLGLFGVLGPGLLGCRESCARDPALISVAPLVGVAANAPMATNAMDHPNLRSFITIYSLLDLRLISHAGYSNREL